ncbi:protein transport protein SEC24 [Strigomonas culicis]|uniref:Protein transport protein SEC24 n=1 Tax=Strigomonas culicis TaxID=28005 RepID=S9UHZ5_9TRYP|nr:protein transport protein SEC24 [Strigomonas culicis]EPY28364.1 protein transport protein SEC24 [Strigomonas culicis]|eukprot:EPY23169.1 protein transport protein SEC24 [Strigomonas culicis]
MAERTPQARVSFITFGSQLHFYNFRHPQVPQLCVPDVDDPFSPLPFMSMCWLEVGSEMEHIEAFLARVPTYAADAREPSSECVVGAAVKVATLVLSGLGGGRVIVSTHGLPSRGVGVLKPREQHKLYGTEKEKELLRPMEGFWSALATDAAKQGIAFDLFVFCGEYCELVTLSALSHVTNGRVFHFSKYDPMIDSTKVQAQLLQLMTEEAGYAGILRVRASAGLRVKRYRGHFLSQNSLDMDLASVTGSSTFFVDLEHEGNLDKKGYVYFQTALLYTTRTGHRRVRVHSFRQRTTPQYSTMFESMDLEAIVFGLAQSAIGEAVNKGPQHARQRLTEQLIKMLTTYRRYAAAEETRGSSSTLLMPTRLRLLALYVLCLLRSDALVEGTTVRIDDRVSNIFDLITMPIHKLLIYLYPSLYAVHHLRDKPHVGTINPATNNYYLPPHEQLILESIVKQGVYVLCDEQARLVYLWIGSRVDPDVSIFLFGVADATTVGLAGGPGEDQFDERLRNLLYALTTRDDGVRRLVVVHEGSVAEESFFKQLKEEKADHSMGYSELLELVHKSVRNALL